MCSRNFVLTYYSVLLFRLLRMPLVTWRNIENKNEENRIEFPCTFWLSLVILKLIDSKIKVIFRELERTAVKLTKVRFNLRFNESC